MSGRGFLFRHLSKQESSENDENSQRNERPPTGGRGRLLASANVTVSSFICNKCNKFLFFCYFLYFD